MTADREPVVIDDEVVITISVQIPAHLEASRRQDAATIVAQQYVSMAWEMTPRFGRLAGVESRLPDFEPMRTRPVADQPRVEIRTPQGMDPGLFVKTLDRELRKHLNSRNGH